MKFTLFTLFILSGLPFALYADSCQSTDAVGSLCTLQVMQLRPTQFSIGADAVACKAEKISKKSKKKLKKYLAKEKRQIPVVIGPDGGFFITDHHHLAAALYLASSSDWGEQDKILTINILANYADKNLSWADFWNDMLQTHRSYNYDNKGIANMNFALLPADVSGLLNDPYRTLSRWVRESCAYVKAGVEQCENIRTDHPHKAPYFMEFYWGNFFRQHIPLPVKDLPVCKALPYSSNCLNDEVAQLKAIYPNAVKLAASEQAKTYFLAQGLNPWDYGFNPANENLPLEWDGVNNACEQLVTD